MKRLKALIKIELPITLLMTLYFIGVTMLGVIEILTRVASGEAEYLQRGIVEVAGYRYAIEFSNLFFGARMQIMFWYFIGCMILVYVSFKKDKNHETGRFLKSLPYTERERLLVKIGMHLSSLFIGFITMATGFMIAAHKTISQTNYIYEGISHGSLYKMLLRPEQMLKLTIVTAFICVAFYLLLVMMQYVITNGVLSILSTGLIFIAPLFIMWNVCNYFGKRLGEMTEVITTHIGELLFVEGKYVETYVSIRGDLHYQGIGRQIAGMGEYLIVYSMIIVLLIIGICFLYKHHTLEQSDIMFPFRGLRWIYIVGATICSGFLMGDVVQRLTDSFVDGRESLLNGWLILGAAIGFVISSKIAFLGCKRKKGRIL